MWGCHAARQTVLAKPSNYLNGFYLVGGLEHVFYFSIYWGMSSSQLTKSIIFQRGRVGQPPTSNGFNGWPFGGLATGDLACWVILKNNMFEIAGKLPERNHKEQRETLSRCHCTTFIQGLIWMRANAKPDG